MDIRKMNEERWDRQVTQGNRWTIPVGPEEIAAARRGTVSVLVTAHKPVPASWIPPLKGLRVLCLAGGGGQQGPLLAAAGAEVTVLDNAPRQLEQDRAVAQREGLALTAVKGDMKDLTVFPDAHFDFILHPCSNCFVDDIKPVWREAYRVLRPGGTLVSGFCHPVLFLFDPDLEKRRILQLKFTAPYSDLTSLTPDQREAWFPDEPLNFGHTLEDQIGGQTEAGFQIIGMYEDRLGGFVDEYLPTLIATRALKPSRTSGGVKRAS